MAKSSQTFKKRQRENKLREKAQLKRERRQQRQSGKKASQVIDSQEGGAYPAQDEVEATAPDELGAEQNE
jgi:hypothetical protein